MELSHKVLVVMKKVETLRNRGYSITLEEEQYRNKVDSLLRELNQPNLYKVYNIFTLYSYNIKRPDWMNWLL